MWTNSSDMFLKRSDEFKEGSKHLPQSAYSVILGETKSTNQ